MENTIARALADSVNVIGLLGHFWPVSVLVAGVGIAALGMNSPKILTGSFSWFFVPFVFPPLYVLWGAIVPHDDPFVRPPRWPVLTLVAFLFLQLAVTVAMTRRAKERRWLGVALGIAAGWLGAASALVAAQSLTGDSL